MYFIGNIYRTFKNGQIWVWTTSEILHLFLVKMSQKTQHIKWLFITYVLLVLDKSWRQSSRSELLDEEMHITSCTTAPYFHDNHVLFLLSVAFNEGILISRFNKLRIALEKNSC